MCPPLTNDTWVYGSDDDTLFRLIALGTDELVRKGYARIKHEVVTGPMPPFGGIIKTSDDLWRIIAFIRSVNPSSLKPAKAPTPPTAIFSVKASNAGVARHRLILPSVSCSSPTE